MKKLFILAASLFGLSVCKSSRRVSTKEALRRWFLVPSGMHLYGICVSMSRYIEECTGQETSIRMTDAFLKKHYKHYSGSPAYPVKSPNYRLSYAAFGAANNYLVGEYGKNRMVLFNLLKKHTPVITLTAGSARVIWCTEEEKLRRNRKK